MAGQGAAEATIERRWREIMAMQKRINREQNKALVGQRLEVLVEGAAEETEHLLVGRHAGPGAGDRRVRSTSTTASAYPGEIVTVEVTEAARLRPGRAGWWTARRRRSSQVPRPGCSEPGEMAETSRGQEA